MRNSIDAVREHLLHVLDWEDAHVGFDRAVEGIPLDLRGVRPPGFEHSAWQLIEHIRIAQDDILDFCINTQYAHSMTWPDDYWPPTPAPTDEAAWTDSLAGYARSRGGLKTLVRDVEDFTAKVPSGSAGQTYLRAILLTADHTAYHVGQLIAIRRALGAWR